MLTPDQKNNVITHMQKLVALLRKYNYQYHVLDKPIVPDETYDTLFKELETLEAQYPELIDENSPTKKVGDYPNTEFKKVDHKIKMLSLANASNINEFDEFYKTIETFLDQDEDINDLEFCAECKLDGLAISLIYIDGKFVQAATRGDGITGEDVTANVRTIKNIPLSLAAPYPSLLEVRGEVIASSRGLQVLNKEMVAKGLQPFANVRNFAAASTRVKNPGVTASRPLSFVAYSLVQIENPPASYNFDTQYGALKLLESLDFTINDQVKLVKGYDQIIEFYQNISNLRKSFDYEIDGTVIKVNSLALQNRFGFVSRTPRWAVAYKFTPRYGTSKLASIDWQVGRTAILTPVAKISPVDIGGVIVKKLSLHNIKQINSLDIMSQDTVSVYRAGDVIPQIESVIEDLRDQDPQFIKYPKHCPECGNRLELVTNSDNTSNSASSVFYDYVIELKDPWQYKYKISSLAQHKDVNTPTHKATSSTASNYLFSSADFVDTKVEQVSSKLSTTVAPQQMKYYQLAVISNYFIRSSLVIKNLLGYQLPASTRDYDNFIAENKYFNKTLVIYGNPENDSTVSELRRNIRLLVQMTNSRRNGYSLADRKTPVSVNYAFIDNPEQDLTSLIELLASDQKQFETYPADIQAVAQSYYMNHIFELVDIHDFDKITNIISKSSNLSSRLLYKLTNRQATQPKTKNLFSQKYIAVTGDFIIGKKNYSRIETGKILIQMGALIDPWVDHDSDYLICGLNPDPEQIELANKYGVHILEQNELIHHLQRVLFTKVEATSFLYCSSRSSSFKSCDAINRQNLIYFFDRRNVWIKDVSEKLISSLYDKGFIKDYTDVLALDYDKTQTINNIYANRYISTRRGGRGFRQLDLDCLGSTQFIKLDSSFSKLKKLFIKETKLSKIFGDAVSKKITIELPKANKMNFATFIKAIGIDELGDISAKILARVFPSFDEIKKASIDQIANIRGLSSTARQFKKYFSNEKNIDLYNRAIANGLKFYTEDKFTIRNQFTNQYVYLDLPSSIDLKEQDRLRKITKIEINTKLDSYGANLQSSPSKDFTNFYLTLPKYQQADLLALSKNSKVLSIEEFLLLEPTQIKPKSSFYCGDKTTQLISAELTPHAKALGMIQDSNFTDLTDYLVYSPKPASNAIYSEIFNPQVIELDDLLDNLDNRLDSFAGKEIKLMFTTLMRQTALTLVTKLKQAGAVIIPEFSTQGQYLITNSKTYKLDLHQALLRLSNKNKALLLGIKQLENYQGLIRPGMTFSFESSLNTSLIETNKQIIQNLFPQSEFVNSNAQVIVFDDRNYFDKLDNSKDSNKNPDQYIPSQRLVDKTYFTKSLNLDAAKALSIDCLNLSQLLAAGELTLEKLIKEVEGKVVTIAGTSLPVIKEIVYQIEDFYQLIMQSASHINLFTTTSTQLVINLDVGISFDHGNQVGKQISLVASNNDLLATVGSYSLELQEQDAIMIKMNNDCSINQSIQNTLPQNTHSIELLRNSTYVITGDFKKITGQSRDQIVTMLQAVNAINQKSVGPSTKFLIANDGGTFKAKKAADLGIVVIDGEKFKAMYDKFIETMNE